VIPCQWKVIQTVRDKFTCRGCERITQPPALFHPIACGCAAAGLLAMALYGMYGLHGLRQTKLRSLARSWPEAAEGGSTARLRRRVSVRHASRARRADVVHAAAAISLGSRTGS
jgi:transposase